MKYLTGPFGKNNPVIVQILGICSALAVTVQLKPAIVMALSVTVVTAFSNLVMSLLRKGIPARIEIGPKDIENNQAVIVRRDTREKYVVSLDVIDTELAGILDTMQSEMLERARAHRDAHTYEAHSYEEFKDIIANKPGFVKGMWCGEQACEDKIKEETTATSRCMPFEQEHIGDVCVCCGKPAKKLVYWGKAY